jgi:hypothetical protein
LSSTGGGIWNGTPGGSTGFAGFAGTGFGAFGLGGAS